MARPAIRAQCSRSRRRAARPAAVAAVGCRRPILKPSLRRIAYACRPASRLSPSLPSPPPAPPARGAERSSRALRERRGGLSPTTSAGRPLPCLIGRVDGLADAPLPPRLARLDSPQQPPRLAGPATRTISLDSERALHERHRCSARVALVLGTSTASIGETETAPIANSTQTAASFRTSVATDVHQPHSLGLFVQAVLGIARAVPDGIHGLLVQRQGIRRGRAPDACRAGRRRDRRRRGYAVRQRAVRLQFAGTGVGAAVPAVRRRARRAVARRGGGFRASRTSRRRQPPPVRRG